MSFPLVGNNLRYGIVIFPYLFYPQARKTTGHAPEQSSLDNWQGGIGWAHAALLLQVTRSHVLDHGRVASFSVVYL